MRTGVAGVVAASVVLFAVGCGARPTPRDPGPPPPAGAVEITLDVKGMTKALNIT